MCTIEDMPELRGRPQEVILGKSAPENLPKEDNIATNENVCRNEEYVIQTSNDVKQIETIPVKITILHTKKESIIVKTEEDPRKPWYFTRV